MINSRITLALVFGWLFGLFTGFLGCAVGMSEYLNPIILIPSIIFDLFLGFMFAWAILTGETQ